MTLGVRTQYVGGHGAASLRIYGRDLAELPKQVRGRLRPKLQQAGLETLSQAAGNASWSARIPAALSLEVSFAQRSPGVTIVADTGRAPHARAFEGIVSDTFRHPVFGRQGPWVTQAARPYLRPAAQSTGARVVELVLEAVDEALAATGFH